MQTIQGDDPEIIMIRGGSCIINPLRSIPRRCPDYTGECILTAEIDLGDVAKGKYDLDVVGHYARPDIFRLYVNDKPSPAVVWSSGEIGNPFGEEDPPMDDESKEKDPGDSR